MPIGDLALAINSDVVILELESTPNELVTLTDIQWNKSAPRNRIVTRAGKLDTYSTELIDFTAVATVTKAVHDKLNTLSTQNARKAYPQETVKITGRNLGGNSANDIVVNATAEFPELSVINPGGGIASTIRFRAIVDNSSYAVP
jgi:hypothetical protein